MNSVHHSRTGPDTDRQEVSAFVKDLAQKTFQDLEGNDSSVIPRWSTSPLVRSVAPENLGGLGFTSAEAYDMQVRLGSYSPSLAAATTMHHVSIQTLVSHATRAPDEEVEVIRAVVGANSVFASAFSEGKPYSSVFDPKFSFEKKGETFVLNGRKAPCSLARSMTFAMTSGRDRENGMRMVALVPNSTQGLSTQPFWHSNVLAAAESDALVFENVEVPAELVFRQDVSEDDALSELFGYFLFGLLISASYVGASFRLVDELAQRPLADVKAKQLARISAAFDLHDRQLRGLAERADQCPASEVAALSTDLLLARMALRRTIDEWFSTIMELIGGMGFIQDSPATRLALTLQAYRFHPPNDAENQAAIDSLMKGGGYVLPNYV
ncbi:hypothetical protein [Rhodococcus sp. IEGM1428]|uniref:hypothetical protein n=1 Tax=Rhodococcus sp. IEGM1428 TaxID=3392191 RepID=UPI003D0CBC3E